MWVKKPLKTVITAAFLFVFTLSCQSNPLYESKSQVKSEKKREMTVKLMEKVDHLETLNKQIKDLAKQISSNLKEYDRESSSIVVTNFVDIDNLSNTNSFGRYVTERLFHEFHQLGFRVFEMQQGKNIRMINLEGAFHLTRESRELLNSYRSDSVVVGTYSIVDNEVILHARLLEHDTSRVISVGSISIKLDINSVAARLVSKGSSSKTILKPLE